MALEPTGIEPQAEAFLGNGGRFDVESGAPALFQTQPAFRYEDAVFAVSTVNGENARFRTPRSDILDAKAGLFGFAFGLDLEVEAARPQVDRANREQLIDTERPIFFRVFMASDVTIGCVGPKDRAWRPCELV